MVSNMYATVKVVKKYVHDRDSTFESFLIAFIRIHSLFYSLCRYEDWGVDELIVEDTWKTQVGTG